MSNVENEKKELNPDFLRMQLDALLADRGKHVANVERLTAGLEKARLDAQKNEGAIELIQHMLGELEGEGNVIDIKPGGKAG